MVVWDVALGLGWLVTGSGYRGAGLAGTFVLENPVQAEEVLRRSRIFAIVTQFSYIHSNTATIRIGGAIDEDRKVA